MLALFNSAEQYVGRPVGTSNVSVSPLDVLQRRGIKSPMLRKGELPKANWHRECLALETLTAAIISGTF